MVTGGHAPGTAQLAATASTSSTPESRSNTTSSPVATSIAVIRSTRSRPVVRGQPVHDHLAADRFGDGVGGQRDRADALQLLRFGGAGVRHRADEELGDVVDVDDRNRARRTARRSGGRTVRRASCRCRVCAATVDPAEVPSSTSAASRRLRRVGRLVGDAAQDAGLPGDARQSAAREHQSTLRHGDECARVVECLDALPSRRSCAAIVLLAGAPAAVAEPPAPPAPIIPPPVQPANVGDLKTEAIALLRQRRVPDRPASGGGARDRVDRRRGPRVDRPAVVFDIDETALSNWEAIEANDFGRVIDGPCTEPPKGPCGWRAWDLRSQSTVIPPTMDVFDRRQEQRRRGLLHHRA